MRKNLKKIILTMLTMGILFICCSCSLLSETNVYRPVEDVSNLEGRRIGTPLCWSADYLLTPRKDIKLYRYETAADAVMALKYKKIDAIAIDNASAGLLVKYIGGLRIHEEPLTTIDIIFIGNSLDPNMMNEFNDFLKVYKETDTYKELLKRINDKENDYVPQNLEKTGTGKTIRVACDEAYFPLIYYDFATRQVMGYDAEILIAFANYMDYQIEFDVCNSSSLEQQFMVHHSDFCVNGLSELEADVYKELGLDISDSVYPMDLVIVDIVDFDAVEQTETLTW